MRILIAAGIYPPDAGGPAVHAKAQLENFPRFGFETGLVAFAHYRKWPKGIRHLFYFLKLLITVPKYDLVYAHDALGAGIPAYLAARLFNKKFMVRLGGDITWEYRIEEKPLSMLEWYERGEHLEDKAFILSRWLLTRAEAVVVTSPLLSVLYLKYYGINPSKVTLIQNPVPEIEKAESTIQEKTMIFASRLVAYKNLGLVLKVFSKISPSHPELKFVIMGDGPDKTRLENLSIELGIKSHVVFTGSLPNSEVLKRTSSCLFAIAPALTEFNPNYILQTISFDKPFLISKEHGLPFEVPEELMFDPRNESELESRIIYLLDEKNYVKAKEKVKSLAFKMTWDDNFRANAELITSLLKG